MAHFRSDDEGGRRWPRRLAFVAPLSVAALALASIGGWVVDSVLAGDRVPRNVSVAGRGIGGLSLDEVRAAVDALAADYAEAPVELVTPDETYETALAALGVTIDVEATVAAALDVESSIAAPVRPFNWLGSFRADRAATVHVAVDVAVLSDALLTLEGERRQPPEEPGLVLTELGFIARPGVPGRGLDASEVTERLPEVIASVDIPLRVEVRPTNLRPRFGDDDAEALASRANDLLAADLEVTVDGQTATMTPAEIAPLVDVITDGEAIDITLDPERGQESLRAKFPDAGEIPVDAGFEVVDGAVRVTPHRDGRACCVAAASEQILEALRSGTGEVTVDLRDAEAGLTTDAAEALGITEVVGEWTVTGPGGSRFTNIERISDVTRGVVIEPGGHFLVNEFVGRRTRENGFVSAGVIYSGRFTQDVGGGISQYATTLFNAAFFAGLDFGEYQSHSIYISRYPYGREATLNFPHPDLEIVNNTPYGVLIWTSYVGSSNTVTLYSTKHLSADQTGQTRSSRGRCTAVTTERTITPDDGEPRKDTVTALYRPGEGVNC